MRTHLGIEYTKIVLFLQTLDLLLGWGPQVDERLNVFKMARLARVMGHHLIRLFQHL